MGGRGSRRGLVVSRAPGPVVHLFLLLSLGLRLVWKRKTVRMWLVWWARRERVTRRVKGAWRSWCRLTKVKEAKR